MLAQALDAAAHVREPVAKRAVRSGRQAFEKRPERSPQWQIMLTCEAGEFEKRSARRARGRHASIRTEPRAFFQRERADMGEVRDPHLHAVDERNRAIDVSERP